MSGPKNTRMVRMLEVQALAIDTIARENALSFSLVMREILNVGLRLREGEPVWRFLQFPPREEPFLQKGEEDKEDEGRSYQGLPD